MILILAITCGVLLIALGYVLLRYAKLKAYADQADLERLTLVIENDELKDALDFIPYEVSKKES